MKRTHVQTLSAIALLLLLTTCSHLFGQRDSVKKDSVDGGFALAFHGGIATFADAEPLHEGVTVNRPGQCFIGELKMRLARNGGGLSFFFQYARFKVDDYPDTTIDAGGVTHTRAVPLQDYAGIFGGLCLYIPFGDTSKIILPFGRLGVGLGFVGGAAPKNPVDAERLGTLRSSTTGLPIGVITGLGLEFRLGNHLSLIGQTTIPFTIVFDVVSNDSGFRSVVPSLTVGLEAR